MAPAIAAAQDFPVDRERLESDGAVVEIIETPAGHPAIRTYTLVDAPRSRIWFALVDYENFRDVFEGIRTEVIDCDSDGALVEFWVDPPVLSEINFVLDRQYPEAGHRLTWVTAEVKSGIVDDIQGSWRIFDADAPGTHLLVYESYVDVGNRVVNWMARPFISRRAKRMTEKIADWIERLPDTEAAGACGAQDPG